MNSIQTKEDFNDALEYVAANSAELIKSVLHHELTVDTVCLFARSVDEYTLVEGWIKNLGAISALSNPPVTMYVDVACEIAGQQIERIGLRRYDSDRPERGYGDYAAPDFDQVVAMVEDTPAMRATISGRGKHLIEVTDIEYDVRGYIVDARNR